MSEWNAETAEWYAANYGDYPTNRLAVNELDLQHNVSIVDVGCGTGAALRYAALKVTAGNLTGIDPVPRMIEIARKLTEQHPAQNRIDFRVGSAEDLPLGNGLADYVFAFDSIDHWQDIGRGLGEIRRILKPDGSLILVKDKGVPGANEALARLGKDLDSAGFDVVEQREIHAEVRFSLWVCRMTQ